MWNSSIGLQDEVAVTTSWIFLANYAGGLFHVLQKMSGLPEIWADSTSTGIGYESHY